VKSDHVAWFGESFHLGYEYRELDLDLVLWIAYNTIYSESRIYKFGFVFILFKYPTNINLPCYNLWRGPINNSIQILFPCNLRQVEYFFHLPRMETINTDIALTNIPPRHLQSHHPFIFLHMPILKNIRFTSHQFIFNLIIFLILILIHLAHSLIPFLINNK